MKSVQSLENLRIEMYGSGRGGKVLCHCDYERVGDYRLLHHGSDILLRFLAAS